MKMETERTTLEPRPSIINLRMIGFAKRNATRALYRKSEEQYRRNQLFRLKTAPIFTLQSKIFRNNNAFCCGTCTPLSRKNAIQKCFGVWDIQNILLIQNEHCGFITSRIKHLVHSWNMNNLEYPDVSQKVLKTENVNVAIEKAIELEFKNQSGNEFETLKQKIETQALQIVGNLGSKFSAGVRRFAFWILTKVLPRVFHRVLVHPVQITMLQNASQNDLPLVFLPAHRSSLDHVLISFALISHGIKAPIVASEHNLNTPLIGWFLKALGAFSMKNDVGSKNSIFRAILQSYLVENLQAGQSVGFFLEKECSRSGKICVPENDVMSSLIVNALTDESVQDATIVPVSINYEQMPNAFDNAISLKNLTSLLRVMWSFLKSNYGMVRIDFGQPFSWREFEESIKKSSSFGRRNLALDLKPNGDFETGYESREYFSRQNSDGVENLYSKEQFLTRHVLFDCDHNTAIMSTNAIAFLLLHQFRKGTTLAELATALEDLQHDVNASHRVVGFAGKKIDVVKYALNLLGPKLVQIETSTDGVETRVNPITELPAVIELNYYSNGVISLYILEAVLATAVCSLLNNATWFSNEKCFVNKDELMQRALDICDILQFEFIFTKPCKLLRNTIPNVIDNFNAKGILILEADALAEKEGNYRRRRYGVDTFNFDGKDSDDYVPPVTRINYYGNEEYRPMFQVLCSILRPLFETYTVCAACLKGLVNTQVTREELLNRITAQAEAYLEEGLIHYEESMSTDPIHNALRLFRQWKVLDCYTHEKETYYYLTKKYDNYSGAHSVFEKMFSLLCEVE